jgi:uncharacterized protein
MSKKVLILHGWMGSPYPHWQDWLAKELNSNNYDVRFPKLPNEKCPILDKWLVSIANILEDFSPDIVVCHSLGNVLWFHILNTMNIKTIDKLFLVAPVSLDCNIQELKTFFPYKVPHNLKSNKSYLIVSNNDEYININEALSLEKELKDINMIILNQAGHINQNSGYTKFDDILKLIEK